MIGRFLMICAGLVSTAHGQIPKSHTPISGETYHAVLDRVFPGERTAAAHSRFYINVRILPPFHAETEINIVLRTDGRCEVGVTSALQPIQQSLADYAATGAPHDLKRLTALAKVKTDSFSMSCDTVRSWMKGFWRAMSEHATLAPNAALKGDGTDEIEVVLDPTEYLVAFGDAQTRLQVAVIGPDPEWSGDEEKLHPVARWVRSIQRSISEQKRQ